MTSIKLESRSGKVLKEKIDLGKDVGNATVDDLQKAIAQSLPKFYPSRQRLTFDNKVLEKGERLSKYNIKSGNSIVFKDLGPQIGWTTVFIIEYLGPILIHPLFYYGQSFFYPGAKPAAHTRIQMLTLILTCLHFLKREYETVFVHRFSNDTMPVKNLPKNCAHYWVLGGLAIAYPVYYPGYNGGWLGGAHSPLVVAGLVALWAWAEVSNFRTHVTLRNLRPPGSRVRKIPYGYGFNWVSCPNYFFEVVGWLCIALLTGSAAAYLFWAAGFGQMYLWAVKKHIRYKKDFGKSYPSKRKVIVPFVL
ncbi:3-oxo-5-alpha-steroid 4-dehydrogenase-domain-containing protein [Phlyctochytrium arcticum]|nr:3-oxo-5-alpha-steroid 4-dehydrogenase-domain-containing protein [Phlyctochytrium arcticum]